MCSALGNTRQFTLSASRASDAPKRRDASWALGTLRSCEEKRGWSWVLVRSTGASLSDERIAAAVHVHRFL